MRPISIPVALVALAMSAASGPPVMAQETKPAAKRAPASTNPAWAKPTVEIIRVPSDILQRRRQGIAAMLERHVRYYRGLGAGRAVKIADAKLAGPFEYTFTGFFSGKKESLTTYCVTVRLIAHALLSGADPIALITVVHPKEGGERMTGTISQFMPARCQNAVFKPFPELEQLRAKRRRALGLTD